MLNIFDNIRVDLDRTDTDRGQFRYRVELWARPGVLISTGWRSEFQYKSPIVKYQAKVKTVYIIDTTDTLSDCIELALKMVHQENVERGFTHA